MPKNDKYDKREVEAIIAAAVEAGRVAGAKGNKDIQRATEDRMNAYRDLKRRIADNKELREEFIKNGPRGRSAGIIRYQKSGSRLSPEEIYDFILMDMDATIEADEQEIKTIDRAVSIIESDPYIRAVTGRFFDGLSDEAIGEEIFCDASTVWRNRRRLMKRIRVYLYGAMAVC